MRARYNLAMRQRQTPRSALPLRWLLTDARNDALLDAALAALPPNSALVLRHYHLRPADRMARMGALARKAQALGHLAILSGTAGEARALGAEGIYGAAALHPAPGLLRLATAHNTAEIAAANAAQADGVFVSPVFATRSHPGAPVLGPAGFHAVAAEATMPVIALGGMSETRAAELGWPRWGAIDGLIQVP